MAEVTRTNSVYLARVKGTDLYKVGISSDPERRITEFGAPCELIHTVKTGAPRKIEKQILERVSNRVTKGEWFKCKDLTPTEVVDEMENQATSAPPPEEAPTRGSHEAPSSPLSDGEEIGYRDLKRHAHQLAKDDRRTYREIAEELDVTEGAVAKAVTTAGPKFHQLQARIVELLSDYTVERREAFVLHPND
jgi:hypothetical protein